MFNRMELRCVIAVIRHGDRTPKQKMKMEVRHQRYSACSVFIFLCSSVLNHRRPTTIKLTDTVQVLFLAVILKCMLTLLELMLGLLLILNANEYQNKTKTYCYSME